jgi:hypothetical protein
MRRSDRWRHVRAATLDGGRRRYVSALEVLAAPGAQRPVHADQPAAVRADALEARPAVRADDPFVVDPLLAGRAVVDRLDLGEEASSARFRSQTSPIFSCGRTIL